MHGLPVQALSRDINRSDSMSKTVKVTYQLQEAENLFLHAKLQEAFPILKELANKGNGRAMYLLAEYYSCTFGKNKRDKVLYWREKGAECGDLLAKLNSPQLYDDFNKIFSQIFPQIKQMAENGDLFAKFELTFLDSKDGNRYLGEVLDAGYFLAQMDMAKAYSGLISIDGIKKDLEQAAKWYRKAAEQGYAKAQYELSKCYYFGRGVTQDYSEAFFWSSKSADQGNVNGQYALGDCYYFGHGVQQNYEKAVGWYTEAANQGNVSAMYDLAICYYYGKGVEIDYQQATELFENAANEGSVESMNLLGDCYYEGKGVPQNYSQAVALYERALNENSPQAYYNLGSCYRWGNGVRKDKEKAKELFKKGIELGSNNCKEAYEEMLKNADRIETAKKIGGKILTVLGEFCNAYAQVYYSDDDE